MKSIIEEGSSICKAIEAAWNRAGKPQEFKVKIFEEAVRNMLGFTSKPAKIAIFFEEAHEQQPVKRAPQQQRPPEAPRHLSEINTGQARHASQTNEGQARMEQPRRTASSQASAQPQERQRQPHAQSTSNVRPLPSQPKPQAPRQQRSLATWEPDLVDIICNQLKDILPLLEIHDATFTTSASNNVLQVTLSQPFAVDAARARVLTSSLGHLLMLVVRHQAKRHIGNLKLVLRTAQ